MTKRTLIGVISSHDSPEKNKSLIQLFDELFSKREYEDVLKNFWFVFTKGTYKRITGKEYGYALSDDVLLRLNTQSTVLPSFSHGGMTLLTFLIIRDKCKTLWSFQTPYTPHPLLPQNRILMRMCDQHDVKKLPNIRSVQYWIENYVKTDKPLEQIEVPLRQIELTSGEIIVTQINEPKENSVVEQIDIDNNVNNPESARKYLAIVTDEDNRKCLYNFVKDYENIFDSNYHKIFTNRTTLPITDNEIFMKNKIIECRGGRDGGFVEIAMEVLFGKCKEIIFIENPELEDSPDNQIILGAANSKDDVLLFTKENWAREWVKSINNDIKQQNKLDIPESIEHSEIGLRIDSNKIGDTPIVFEYSDEKFMITKNDDNKIKIKLVE